MTFQAILQLHGKTATGIQVPEKIIEELGAGKRPHVQVTLNGFTFETTVGIMHGQYLIPVSAERREAVNVSAGDKLSVEISLKEIK